MTNNHEVETFDDYCRRDDVTECPECGGLVPTSEFDDEATNWHADVCHDCLYDEEFPEGDAE